MKRKKIFIYIIFFLLLASSLGYTGERIGIIYPSLFITEELASFTQVVSYLKEDLRKEVYVVNARPKEKEIMDVYKLLKKKGVKKFIVKDEEKDLSFLYKRVSLKDTFFSFSSSSSLALRKNIHRVMPTYKEMIEVFKEYAIEKGAKSIYVIIENLQDPNLKELKGVFSSYKGKYTVLPLENLITPFGLTDKLSFDNSYIFLYATSYKKGGIFAQLITQKTKKFHLVIFGNLISPSFLALTKGLESHISVESDIELTAYKEEYKKFKKAFESNGILASLYDFSKVKFIFSTINLKKIQPKKEVKIKIRELKDYEE